MNWQEVDDTIKQLASKITHKPDIIVGVIRGGLIPARLLAKYLSVKDMYALSVKKQGNRRLVTIEIKESLSGKHVLIVEDVLESGVSMVTALNYLKTLGAKVETASLYFQPQTKIVPNYYISELYEVPTFPWEWLQ